MVMLSFQDSVRLLGRYNISYCKNKIVKSKEEAVKAAKILGFPVVMKLVSEGVLHKTDVGAVKIALGDVESVEDAFDYFRKHFSNGQVIVQKAAQGLEVIVGAKRDSQFGPTVVFGLGGIFVEAIKDVSLRVAPITRGDALEMIHDLKSSVILEGARGRKPVDINQLADILLKVSKLMMKNKKIKELDLNPIIINEKSASVVDVRVIV
ncbi:MAG: acetate--CoA ligase family protein [archaeon]